MVVRQITHLAAIPVLAVAVAVVVRHLPVVTPIIFLAVVAVAVALASMDRVQAVVVAHMLAAQRA
jgi:hypothetical protein